MSSASFAAPDADRQKTQSVRPSGPQTADGSQREPSGEHPLQRRPARVATAGQRLLDIAISLTALAILAPVLILIALLIKATSPGPILYYQTRVGQNRRGEDRRESAPAGGPDRRRRDRRICTGHGRPFAIVKFRTMVVNAEEYGPQWSSENDPRITTIGRILRKTRLDEVPQFFNVLRGDMSLIGPRPERPFFVDRFVSDVPRYSERLQVRPGITGQAQVNLDYDSTVEDVVKKVEQDLDYVENRSLWRDFGILLKTVAVVVTGKGAR